MKYSYLLVFFITLLFLFLLNTLRIDSELKNFNESQYDSYFREIETIKKNQRIVSTSIYDNLINIPKVINVFKKAHIGNEKEKDLVRQELYNLLKDQYKQFKTYGIQQLHFHLPDNESFLRFHKVSKFGDNLTKIRESVKYVNSYKKPISGFEEGKIFNGYRYVFPLFDKNNIHIGSVEVSSSLLNFKKIFQATHDLFIDFIFTKETIENKVFKSQLDNYLKYLSYENFLIQTTIDEYNQQSGFVTNLYEILDDENFKKNLLPIRKNIYSKFLYYDLHTIFFMPLFNDFTKKPVGYTIILGESDYFKYFFKSIIFSYIILIIISFLIAYNLNRTHVLKEEIEKRKVYESASYTDALTSLRNRKSYDERLEEKISICKRYETTFSMILYDIDYFKSINDTYGHDAGDKVLIKMSSLIKNSLRESDLIFRIGGEEFIILMPHTIDKTAYKIAENIRNIVENELKVINNKTITISLGVSEYQKDDTPKSLFKRCDNALYKSKESGRNKTTIN